MIRVPGEWKRQLLVRAGVDVHRRPRGLIRSGSELWLRPEHLFAFLASNHPGEELALVQVGAFDGHDPVAEALEKFGWRGLLIEPQPNAFSRLARTHEGNKRVQLLNAAIDKRNGTRTLYAVDEADDLPWWVGGVASFDPEHFRKAVPGIDLEDRIRRIPVATVTFDQALTEAGIDQVDVLFVDTEGYDLEILKMFDVPRRLPSLIVYEHQHLSKADRNDAADILIACGYALAMAHDWSGDTIAYLQNGTAQIN